MKILKGNVRNKEKSEGSIAKCYLADECMRFVSRFMKQAADLDNPKSRNQTFGNDAILGGRPLSSGSSIMLADERLQIAHRYVLCNTNIVDEYQE